MDQLKAMQICKKVHEKPRTLEKLEVCRNLNVVPAVGQISRDLWCKAGWEEAVSIVQEPSGCNS